MKKKKKKDTRIRNTANLQVKRTGRRDIRGHCGFSPTTPTVHVHNRGTSILHEPARENLHRQFVFLPYTAPKSREPAGTRVSGLATADNVQSHTYVVGRDDKIGI